MNYKFTSLKPILDILSQGQEFSAWEISEHLWKSRQLVHKYLKQLINEWKIKKVGKTPHAKYRLLQESSDKTDYWELETREIVPLDYKTTKILEEAFFKFSPTWEKLTWVDWIVEWLQERNNNVHSSITEYLRLHTYFESQKDDCWMLHAEQSFWKHFEINYLEQVLYADQYIYWQFWRWKLSELAYYGKQLQDKNLISESIKIILPKLKCIISRWSFDAIAITPWSVKRENQILKILQKKLWVLKLPFVNVIKYSQSWILIPQKSLKKSEDRIKNAKSTIFIDDRHIWNYKKVLLIDDFVGSGATLNETAKKLKDEWVQEVVGFVFVGNTDLQYEVIYEI